MSAGKKRQVGNSPFKSEIREKFEFRNSKTEGKSKTETRKEFDHGLLGFHGSFFQPSNPESSAGFQPA
ncbi:MAG TPA: hypothetical protein VN794_18255, partial [Methylomirabilota bacterium]|nr:hypothetical protein [Methylomirabilota bacterium]